MGKKSKNIQKVSDMLDGTYGGKIQVSQYSNDIHANREVGERYFDHDDKEWEKTTWGRSSIKAVHVGLGDACSDCKKLISKKWDKDVYKWNKRCYYCQIDHEAKFPRNIQGTDHITKKIDSHTEYIIERGDNYIKGWMKEKKIYEKETKEEKIFDKELTNALANSNVEMAINKNKNMTK